MARHNKFILYSKKCAKPTMSQIGNTKNVVLIVIYNNIILFRCSETGEKSNIFAVDKMFMFSKFYVLKRSLNFITLNQRYLKLRCQPKTIEKSLFYFQSAVILE